MRRPFCVLETGRLRAGKAMTGGSRMNESS